MDYIGNTLYVSDLDGTLLNTGARLSDYTVDALNTLMAKGLKFSYATARAFASSRELTQRLPLTLPVITNNGAIIADPVTGAPIQGVYMEKSAAAQALDLILSNGANLSVFARVEGKDRFIRPLGHPDKWRQFLGKPGQADNRLLEARTREELLAGDTLYITVKGTEEETKQLHEKIKHLKDFYINVQQDTYDPGKWFLDIAHSRATKGQALLSLKELTGVDKIVCFGDNQNDLTMFETADEACAVGDCPAALLNRATRVLACCDEDSVAKWLESQWQAR